MSIYLTLYNSYNMLCNSYPYITLQSLLLQILEVEFRTKNNEELNIINNEFYLILKLHLKLPCLVLSKQVHCSEFLCLCSSTFYLFISILISSCDAA